MVTKTPTWRKGLLWVVGSGWTVVKTGRLLTATGLARKKSSHRKKYHLPKLAPVKPVKRKRAKPKPRKDTARYISTRLTKEMKQSAEHLTAEGYVTDYRVHLNKDGTVDGELRVRPKRGQEVTRIFLRMEENTKPMSAGKTDTWISAGTRYKPREKEEFYIRFMGMSQANTNYSRNKGTFRATNLVGAREIHERMADRGRRKPEQVIMRVHWNKDNKQPTRKGKKRTKS